MPTTDKNHLAASGGQLFLKEVFINFVARLVNDREGEQVENRTGKQGRIQSPFRSNWDSISVCLFLFYFFFIFYSCGSTSPFLKKNICLSWCLGNFTPTRQVRCSSRLQRAH